jgi:hypothetical protein
MTHWNIGDLKSNVNSHMSIQYVNQSESLSWPFSDLLGDKCCLQRKYMCRQHETLDCRKFHNPLSNSCHRSGKGHACVTTEWLPFVKFVARGGYLFFNWYLRLGNQVFDFLMVGSAKFCHEKHFSLVPPTAINNDMSLRAYLAQSQSKCLSYARSWVRFFLRTHDTFEKRVSERCTENRGFSRGTPVSFHRVGPNWISP